jgi:uncharacterized protein (DUF433 family)
MRTETLESATVEPTEHPHMVRISGVCGGRPILAGTRLSVRHIAHLYKAGETVEEILQAHPYLKAAAVYDAMSDSLDHQADIEQELLANRLDVLLGKQGLAIDAQGFVSISKNAGPA